jgi:segregation and condensation protein A
MPPDDESTPASDELELEEEAEEERAAVSSLHAGKLDLEKLVSKPAWKEVLLDLVVKEQLDPWNIDVGIIASKYVEHVRGLQTLDLHIPANIILAASILLRFKSDAIRIEEEVQDVEAQTYVGEDVPAIEVPLLTLRTRIPPKRKVTLDELVAALEDVFDEQKKREARLSEPVLEERIVLQLPEFDIEKQMSEVFSRVKTKADSEGLTTFSRLIGNETQEEKIYTLLPLLFLTQAGKVSIFQEKFFGEIFVQLLKDGQEKLKKAKAG